MAYRRGDSVEFLPEFMDPGDAEFDWVVVADEDKGRVDVSPENHPMTIRPIYTVKSSQIRLKASGVESTCRKQ